MDMNESQQKQFFFSLGFLAARATRLEAFVAFWWKLLEFGFEMGDQQKAKAIEAHIPDKY